MSIPAFVHDELTRLGIEVPAEMLEKLAAYLDHLLTVNQTMNLTAVRDADGAWRRLIIDSLTLLPMLDDVPEDAAVIDVGSGGGLPGIPLAITRPDLKVMLLKPRGRSEFLESCIEKLDLANVDVLDTRAELAGQDKQYRHKYDVAVCRGVGPMRKLLEYTLPFVKVGGMLLAMKGPKAEQELEEAGDAIQELGGGEIQVIEAYPEGFDINTVVVRVGKQSLTPKQYPRSPGTPRLSPL